MIFRSSLTNFLTFLFGILLTGLFIAASILAIQAWTVHARALSIASFTNTDRTLIDAIIAVRAQIPQDTTALITEDDPRRTMGRADKDATKAVVEALDALSNTSLGDRGRYVAAIQQARRNESDERIGVDRQAVRPRGDRDLSAADSWRTAVHQTVDALNMASIAINNTVRADDATVAELVQVRQLSWSIRDNYGVQCSELRSNVNKSTPLGAQQHDMLLGRRAIYTSDWLTLNEFLLRPGLSDELSRRIELAHDTTEKAQAKVDTIIARLNGSDEPAIAGAEWTTLCDAPFIAILAIGQQAEAEAHRHADELRASALRNMLLASLGLTLVVAFGVYSVVNVRRRLTRPMRALTATIARLSHRQLDEPVETSGSPDELDSMAKALENLRLSEIEAGRLQQAMSQFTANASHQMRTPLSILQVHIAVLAKLVPPNGDARTSLKDIRDAADRLQNLLIQLLILARADSGHSARANEAPIDAESTIKEVVTNHLQQALKAQVELHFECSHRPLSIHGNSMLVREVFNNLIDNAIRYNKPGGAVVVRLLNEKGRLTVDVEDDGPGIPDSELDNVFMRFYRLKRDLGRPGSGLGLAIVQSFVATLNGEIRMSAGEGGRGLRVRTTFRQPVGGNADPGVVRRRPA